LPRAPCAGIEAIERKAGHFRQAGFGIGLAVMLEAEVIGMEQAQHRAGVAAAQGPQALGIADKTALRKGLLPFLHQVAAIIALAALAGGQEARTAAAQHDIQPTA
jgi:hypothetical protein